MSKSKTHRILLAILAGALFCAAIGPSVLRACDDGAQDVALINGELPGGG